MPSEQESPKNRAAGLVAGPPSLSCGERHHPSGLQGKRFVRCRIGLTARRVVRTIQRNCRKQGFSTCKRRDAHASRQERLRIRMRMRRSLWVSRCTPGLLLQIWVIGAEESWVEFQGQVGSESRNSDRVNCGQKLENRVKINGCVNRESQKCGRRFQEESRNRNRKRTGAPDCLGMDLKDGQGSNELANTKTQAGTRRR